MSQFLIEFQKTAHVEECIEPISDSTEAHVRFMELTSGDEDEFIYLDFTEILTGGEPITIGTAAGYIA